MRDDNIIHYSKNDFYYIQAYIENIHGYYLVIKGKDICYKTRKCSNDAFETILIHGAATIQKQSNETKNTYKL